MFEIDQQQLPFQSYYIDLESGARIHYLDEGEGPVLLLLHGNPTWSYLYRHIIAALKDDFRLIAPDYPGFGLSTPPQRYRFTAREHADSMIDLVEALDLTEVTIMVQDWGGPIGFAAAEAMSERTSGFIIGNTWAWPLERIGHKIFSTLMGGWVGQFGAWCCNAVVRFFMSQGVVNQLSAADLEMYLAPFADPDSRSPTHIFPAQLWDADEFLGDVYEGLDDLSGLPVLITWGMDDFAFKEPERVRFEQIFTRHQTVLLEGAGHFIQEDAPVEIASAIRNWHPAQVMIKED